MRKALPYVVVAAVLLVVLAGMGWAVWASRDFGSWTGGSRAILIMIAVGAVLTGGLTALLVWLAFYSERKGYDEPFHFDSHEDGA
jgi:hypothetical protein